MLQELEKRDKPLTVRYNLMERCRTVLETKLKEWIQQGLIEI